VQHNHCGAALLHYGAHDNAFLGHLKVGTDFALYFSWQQRQLRSN
jgi:hypothetical protein